MNFDDDGNLLIRDDWTPDELAAIGASAEGHDATVRRVENWCWREAERTGQMWKVNLVGCVPIPRIRAATDLLAYHTAFSTAPDRLDGEVGAVSRVSGDHVDLAIGFDGEPIAPWESEEPHQAQVPIAVVRSGNLLQRHIIRGGYTLSDALAAVSDTNSPYCDLRILPDQYHVQRAAAQRERARKAARKVLLFNEADESSISYTGIWPIPAGQFCIFLRYCEGCIGALFDRYSVGKSLVIDPAEHELG